MSYFEAIKRFLREVDRDKEYIDRAINPMDYMRHDVNDPQYKVFMDEACASWEDFSNNGEPLQPEDCDTDSVHNE